jgi:hypothetical protein
LSRRCPMLGHDVPFSYCREPAQEIPCRKIYDCWWEQFDIKSFIAAHYSDEVQKAIVQPPKPKMLSLLEIIEQASRRNPGSWMEIPAQ